MGTMHSPKTGRGKPLQERELYSKRFFVEIYRVPVPFVLLILEKKMLRNENRDSNEYIALRETAWTYCIGYSSQISWLISEMKVGCIHLLIYQQLEMQELAAEQPLPRQAVWSVRAGGTDRPSQYKSRLPNKKMMVSVRGCSSI